MNTKFRAFDKETGKIFKVTDLYFDGNGVRACRILGQTSKSQYKKSDFMYASRFVLMQWTGLVDKHDAEVHNGDILRTTKGIGFVEYNAPDYLLVLNDSSTILLSELSAVPATDAHNPMLKYCEIIGNIHATPELLKVAI